MLQTVTGRVQFLYGLYPHLGIWVDSKKPCDSISGIEDIVLYALAHEHAVENRFWRIRIGSSLTYPRDMVLDLRNSQKPSFSLYQARTDVILGRFLRRCVPSLVDISRWGSEISQPCWVGASVWFVGDSVAQVYDMLRMHDPNRKWKNRQVIRGDQVISDFDHAQ